MSESAERMSDALGARPSEASVDARARWFGAALGASWAAGGLEFLIAEQVLPVRLALLDAVLLLPALAAEFLFPALLVAGSALIAEPRLPRLRFPGRDAGFATSVAMLTTLGLVASEILLGAKSEFHERTDWLRGACAFFLVFVAALVLAVARKKLRAAWVRAWLESRAAPPVFLGTLAVAMSLLAALVFTPLGMVRPGQLAAVLATAAWVLAFGSGLRPPSPRVARGFAVGLVLTFLLGVFASRRPSVRFVLFNHASLASAFARLNQELLDIDQDGASSTVLGGQDCAEFNASRGPTARELPADGVDQDCSGGDAPAQPFTSDVRPLRLLCTPSEVPRSAVLITIDALRADSLEPGTMPALSQFARVTQRFDRAYAPATMTKVSIASMLSGRVVSDLSRSSLFLEKKLELGTMLPRRLSQAGFRTAAFFYFEIPPTILDGFGSINRQRAIDVFVPAVKQRFTSASVTNGGLEFLESIGDQRFFLWMHYPDGHAPYLRLGDPNFEGAKLEDYRSELAYVDIHLGRFLAWLQQKNLERTTLVIITADHGEGLGEHGREGHGPDVFETSTRVPLLLWVPGCGAARVAVPVTTASIAPTLLELLGATPKPETPTDASMPEVAPPAGVPHPIVSESVFTTEGVVKRALVQGPHKLIVDVRSGGRLLFDLEADPEERRDLYDSRPDLAKRLEASYQHWLDRPLPEPESAP